MTRSNLRERGFTLAELMTSIAIVAVLGTSLFGLAHRASADERRLGADHRALHELRSTLAMLEADLRSASDCEITDDRIELSRFDGRGIVWRRDGDRLLRDERPCLAPLLALHAERDGQLVRIGLELAPRQPGRPGARVTTSVRLRAEDRLRAEEANR